MIRTFDTELRKKIMDDFNLVAEKACSAEEEATQIIEKYKIIDRKDKNKKWDSIIITEELSSEKQSVLSIAVGRILRKLAKQEK